MINASLDTTSSEQVTPRRMLRTVLSFLFFVLCAPAFAAPDKFEDIRAFIRAELVDQSIPSVAVAVAQDGKILWEQGFGWADRAKRIPATEHTMYSLASTSKPITATGLMVLAQAGRIDLDAPVNDYLGLAKLRARVGEDSEATVRRVANHTAGLPLYAQFFYADEPYRRPSMDETLLRYGQLLTAPGETYQYSNLGYGVLDYVIERVSGMSYAEFMRREVFLPLGLTRTSVGIERELADYAAPRYGIDGLPIAYYESSHPGGSDIYSSAHDLVRFGMFHLKAHLRDQKAILSDASLDEMHRRSAGATPDSGYGIGFGIRASNGRHVIEHDGSMGGVVAQLQLFPDAKLVLVVLSNSSSQLHFRTAERIAAKLLLGWRAPAPSSWPPARPFVTPTQLSGVWKGTVATYVKDVPLELRFLADGNVHATVGDQPATLVNQASFEDDEFKGRLAAQLQTPDTEPFANSIRLSLRLRGDVLQGAAFAVTRGPDYPRMRNWLPHWVELRREAR